MWFPGTFPDSQASSLGIMESLSRLQNERWEDSPCWRRVVSGSPGSAYLTGSGHLPSEPVCTHKLDSPLGGAVRHKELAVNGGTRLRKARVQLSRGAPGPTDCYGTQRSYSQFLRTHIPRVRFISKGTVRCQWKQNPFGGSGTLDGRLWFNQPCADWCLLTTQTREEDPQLRKHLYQTACRHI